MIAQSKPSIRKAQAALANLKSAEAMREKRAFGKDVAVSSCKNRKRRLRLEADDEAWLLYYFAKDSGTEDPLTYAFTSQQKIMIAAIGNAIVNNEDQALAATRGEGKSTYFERLLLKYTLQGLLKFSVLFSATGSAAEDSLASIKAEIEQNQRLQADYPEVCDPVRSLEGTPNRAHYQTVSGKRHDTKASYSRQSSRFVWCGQEIYLPNVPGSPSAGAIIATRGLDAAARGLKKKGIRPGIVGIDDPDTEDSSRSEDQAAKLERRIDRSLAALGSQKKRVARVMLTTLQSRISVSFKFTDPKQKPSWHGKRFRFLVSPPERQDLWEEYVELRQNDWREGTHTAIELYTTRRAEMDAGSVVANPNRKDASHLSALQFYYDQVARVGKEAVATEYDNDPPEESAIVESGINPTRIQKQVNGYDRRIIPPGCILLTQGMDVRKVALHWVIRAWCADATGHTIDYGIHEVRGTTYGSEDGLDVAIRRAVMERVEATKETEYMTTDGELLPVDLSLVDAGWRTDAVYAACFEIGTGLMPIMGFGKSSGCTQANFAELQRRTQDKKPGDGWFLSRKGKLWLVCADTDRWKAWEHDRWMTSPGKTGAMQIFGLESDKPDRLSDDQKNHHAYARHICNETEVEEPYRGVVRRAWKAKSDNTHWLDASYYSDVAANMRGVRLAIASPSKAARLEAKARLTLAQMAASNR